MNLAYFKKSKYTKEETLKNIKEAASKNGMSILGETDLEKTEGTLLQVCSKEWTDNLLKNDKNLVGLMPCSILILDHNGQVMIGAGNPIILGGVSENPDIHKLAIEAEEKIKKLINEVSGNENQKPSKIKLYSTTTCPYCIMEKQWLESNKVQHEVIYVDKDQKEAENMVKNTGQMGVPVTELVYDDNDSEFIVGFNKLQLSKAIGL